MKAELVEKIRKAFPDVEHEKSLDFDVFTANKSDYYKLAQFLKSELDLDFDHMSDLSGVNYIEHLEAVSHLYSYGLGHKLRLKTIVTRDEPNVDSLTSIWSTADWHEREAWDLYGIVFTGHPNLKRILSSDDQQGHPYRKDVPLENNEEWLLEDETPLKDYGLPETWEW